MTCIHNKGTSNESIEYYHYVLETPELVFSIAAEFVENAEENVSKQDCERNAFKRLAPRLKQVFKRLPSCDFIHEQRPKPLDIENQGFNSQKNQGYDLTHVFSRNPTAMKNHYLLIQIGHMLAQLAAFGWKELTAGYKSIRHFRWKMLQDMLQHAVPADMTERLEQLIYLPRYVP